MSLNKKIKDYYKNKKRILFTTPSHNQGAFINDSSRELLGEKFYKCDFSEIEGFDNLRKPEGALKALQRKISDIYHSKQSFMLTNGSSSGIVSLMLSLLKEDDEVLIARNCHISTVNGLVLTGAKPIWFMPEYDSQWGVFKGITADDIEKALILNSNVKALILTSPTYEGLFSDIEGISKVTKQYGVKLIVDEAHGALLNFGDFKTKPAILCGADASVQSLHKTAGAPNPCALLHISKESDIEPQSIQKALNLINTTSPSYPLLSAIESAVEYLDSVKGKKHLQKLLKNIEIFKEKLKTGISLYEGFNDPTKLLIKIDGVSGFAASEVLNEKYGIEEEFSNENSMLFITGIGTDEKKLRDLRNALKSIHSTEPSDTKKINYTLPKISFTPRQAYFKNQKTIKTCEATGCTAGETVVSYPPGIPVIIAGEIIREETLQFLEQSEISVCI